MSRSAAGRVRTDDVGLSLPSRKLLNSFPKLAKEWGSMTDPININELLHDHVVLDLNCIDRIYLNVYVPNLQVGGQVARFLTDHLGYDIASPVLFKRIGERFRQAVKDYAAENDIPILVLKRPNRTRWDDRKVDHVRPYFEKATEPGVVATLQTQEVQKVFMGYNRSKKKGVANVAFEKADRAVTCYYFYILDRQFGEGFIKICTYFPYPGKVWLNGHSWAMRQADRAGLSYTELKNGFATCSDPKRLQRICDRLGPGDLQGFFDRWITRIPTPLTKADRKAGYWWDLSMRQVEVSRTIVFDAPRKARSFFESLVTDNITIGRPEEVSIVFQRQVRKTTKEPFRTRIFTQGTDVKLDFRYKHSRVKQYLKEGRALRIETVINKPWDIGVLARIHHLPELVDKARQVNDRLLKLESVGQGCALESALFERISQPYVREGQRTGALRFGDERVMALAGALCMEVHAVAGGFTNKSLRALVAGLLGTPYTQGQMSYDLRRLRLHKLIERLPHTNTYVLTSDGMRVVLFFTKVHDRVLRPLLAADGPPASLKVRSALKTIYQTVDEYVAQARIREAA